MDDFAALPPSNAYRLIDFDEAEVRPGFVTGTWILVVAGTKPSKNMLVDLSPRIYIRQPEHWGIEVVGIIPGDIGLPAQAPYRVSLPLEGFIGTEGIEVIGATRSEKHRVSSDGAPKVDRGSGKDMPVTQHPSRNWRAYLDHMPPGKSIYVSGTITFPTGGYKAKLQPREPQGINPRDLLLDLVVTEPTGAVPDVLTDVDVEYTADTTIDYQTATVLGYASFKVQPIH